MVRLGVPERRFYQLLAAVLSDYMKKHPQKSSHPAGSLPHGGSHLF